MKQCEVCQATIHEGSLCADCQKAADLLDRYRANPNDPKRDKPGPYDQD